MMMRPLLSLAVGALAAAACGANNERAAAGVPAPGAGTPLSVVTYNLYVGADLTMLFSSALDSDAVPGELARIFGAVQASDPAERMDAVAAQIARVAPDVIALDEAALWRTQSPPDGAASPAGDVAYDFLAMVIDGLARRGLSYTVAVEAPRSDVEATAAAMPAVDVRLTDRDVVLIRDGSAAAIAATAQDDFTSELVVPTIALGVVKVERGWISVDLQVGTRTVRLVHTHLEAVAPPIREAQAAELLLGPASRDDLVVVGDFNFAPGSLAYTGFEQAGLIEQWPLANPADPGPTCCQAPDVRNQTSMLDERIDLIWTRGPIAASAAQRLGADPADRTASGLWPSDHAGVYVQLEVAP